MVGPEFVVEVEFDQSMECGPEQTRQHNRVADEASCRDRLVSNGAHGLAVSVDLCVEDGMGFGVWLVGLEHEPIHVWFFPGERDVLVGQ